MAEIYKFFNSAPGDKRVYQAADFASYFGSVLSTGFLHTDNVPGMAVRVVPGTLTTVVSPGKAIMKGYFYENTADLTLTHKIPEVNFDRWDRIVLRLNLNNSERSVKLLVKEGVSSANPQLPALQRDNFIYEISLARVQVRKNTAQLLPADLIDERLDQNLGGLVSSLISIPTSQFQKQWDDFMESVQDDGFATTAYVNTKDNEVKSYADGKFRTPAQLKTANLVKNSSAYLGLQNWNLPGGGGWTANPNQTTGAYFGHTAAVTNGAFSALTSAQIDVSAGAVYTIQASMHSTGATTMGIEVCRSSDA